MGQVYAEIDERIATFISAQHVFFVATAPSGAEGHINISPKGHDTLRILDPQTVAYLDLTGSGIETVAHLRDNGRITFLFCALEGPPKILRLHGCGEVIEPGHIDFAPLCAQFPRMQATRSIVRVALDRIADSCGYGVPMYQYVGERSQLREWAERKGPDGVVSYRAAHNARSIDGLPGLPSAATRAVDRER